MYCGNLCQKLKCVQLSQRQNFQLGITSLLLMLLMLGFLWKTSQCLGHMENLTVGTSLCFLGECNPGMRQSFDQDAVLPVLSQHAGTETLPQLLSQRHEGLLSEPGGPRCRVEPLHR